MNIICTALVALFAAGIANAGGPPEWHAERECLSQKLEEAYRHEWKAEDSCSGVSEEAEREGLDEWLLALQLIYPDEEASRWHIARAAILLDSDIPLDKYGLESSNLFGQTGLVGEKGPDPEGRMKALPFLLLAKDLGAPWAEERLETCKRDTAGFYIIDFCYTAEELAQGPALLRALYADLDAGPPPKSVQLRLELDRVLSISRTDDYEHQSQSRLEELARSEDNYVAGIALWELGMRAGRSDKGHRLIVRAEALLDAYRTTITSSPILSYSYRYYLKYDYENQVVQIEKRAEVLPLLLFVFEQEGESGWPEELLKTYTTEELAIGRATLVTLKRELQP